MGKSGNSGPHPVLKYCMATPITLDAIQYTERPLGKVKEKKAMSRGIIHSIMVWLDCCLGSSAGVMVIFCWTQLDTKTKTGMTILVGSGSAKSSHKKLAFRGAAAWIENQGIHEYSFSESPTKSSGLENTV